MENLFTIVINLARNPERKIFMDTQLHNMRIPHIFLDATDGKSADFTQIYDEEISIKNNGAPLTASEKGCALSHRRALEAFLASQNPFGFILEDDIELDQNFPQVLSRLLKHEQQDVWTYLQFNYTPTGWKGVRLWWFLFYELLKQKKRSPRFLVKLPWHLTKGCVASVLYLLQGIHEWWSRKTNSLHIASVYKDHYLAGCYVLTREAARALIDLNTPIAYTADRIHNVARRTGYITHKLYTPRLARQKRETFESSINNEHFGKEVISY